MDSASSSNIPVVFITGFGPFGSILVNPSWEIAKLLKTYLEWTCPIHIITEQMKVTYDDVSTKVPDYWLKYNPKLVIHLGVAAETEEIQIERYACNSNYCFGDINSCTPETGRCIQQDAPDMLSTLLPIDDICARVQRRANLPVTISEDAGRFLCEYIYYQSLFIDRKRTVFIHIPEFDDKFTIQNVAETIQLIIYELLRCVDPLPVLNPNGNYLINSNMKTNLDINNETIKSDRLF